MKNYTEEVKPLRDLSRGKIFMWEKETIDTFEKLKDKLCQPPEEGGLVLMLPDWKKQFVLDTDASKYAVGAVLSQRSDDDGGKKGKLKPVMLSAESSHPRKSTTSQGIEKRLRLFGHLGD